MKMPVVKAFENGTFELATANGWKITHPVVPETSMVTVMESAEWDAELTIVCSALEEGGSVYVTLIPALEGVIDREVTIAESDDDEDIDELLADAVNKGLTEVGNEYNEDHTDNEEAAE